MSTLVTLAPSGVLDTSTLEQKEAYLLELLRGLGSVIIAYSGGADSAYLAWAAGRALGENALAVTADSASLPASHKRDAEAFARQHSIRHETVFTLEFENPDYVKNAPDRCFHCKDELFGRLDQLSHLGGAVMSRNFLPLVPEKVLAVFQTHPAARKRRP